MDEKKLAANLKKIRVEHNIKQGDVARVLGVDRSAYSGYEIGRANPSVKNLCNLADIYNVSIGTLVGREDEKEVYKVKIANISGEVDPIAMLDRDEQILLMYFRLIPKKKKKEVLDAFADLVEKKNKEKD